MAIEFGTFSHYNLFNDKYQLDKYIIEPFHKQKGRRYSNI
jgi:hypothetical protein